MAKFPQNWAIELSPYISLKEIEHLIEKSEEKRKKNLVFPTSENIFKALELTKPSEVRCVIIGQDPYHQPNQAQGLSFSVSKQVKQPPSLKNMMNELFQDLGANQRAILDVKDLTDWSRNGVLLLNRIFTVEQGSPMSHADIGWQKLSNAIIQYLNAKNTHIAFVLMGKQAQELTQFITNPNHLLIKTVHPSPLSAYQGFFGSKIYSSVNSFLQSHQLPEIPWMCVVENNHLF